MKIATLHFGEMEFTEQDVFHFTQGLPGLDDHRQFLLIPLEEGIPFSYLQSVEEGNLSILVTNPFDFFQDYDFSLSEEVRQELRIEEPIEVEVWSAVTVNEDLMEATVNLLAPIVVNSKKRIGKQIILHDSSYHVKHQLPLAIADESTK
ncbi:flagellar assembly protein FliW [Paenibacillus piri]|nr:flagellar assembly protein FliW [Paenibacillus piri]